MLEGSRRVSAALKERIARYVVAHRQSDGGFRGRSGGSDPYYTDFALRLLALTKPDEIVRSVAYARTEGPFADVPELFSWLSVAERCGVPPPTDATQWLSQWRLPSGCYARGGQISAYWTFLGSLCEDKAGVGHRVSADSVKAVLELQQHDGGFIDCGPGRRSQTNPTCAAMAYLCRPGCLKTGLPVANALSRAAAFLRSMECPGGGVFASSESAKPDLLSTFTSMAVLALTGGLDTGTLKRNLQFAGSLATPDGGFRSCAADAESDLEYTYYGLGCLCLAAAKAYP